MATASVGSYTHPLFYNLGEMGAELKVSIVGVLTTISRIYFGGCVGVGSS